MQVSSLQREKDSLAESYHVIESQCDSFKNQVDLATRRVAELASQNADLDEERETLSQKYAEAQQSLANYTQTIAGMEEERELSASGARHEEVDDLRAQVADLEAKNVVLEQQKASFGEKEESLTAQAADLQAEIEILQAMISELTRERGAVEEDKLALEAQVEELKKRISSETTAMETMGEQLLYVMSQVLIQMTIEGGIACSQLQILIAYIACLYVLPLMVCSYTASLSLPWIYSRV